MLVTWCISALLCATQIAEAKQPLSQQLAKVPAGTALKVYANDGRVVQGVLAAQSESGFELRSLGGNGVTTFSFTEVKSVDKVKTKKGGKGKWIAIGLAAAAGVAVAVGLSGLKGDIAGR
jgi:hypothetical protein